MYRNLSVFLLSACLLCPMALNADDHHHDKRYYDKGNRDYHTWNNQEDRAYRIYLKEQNREYRDFHREKTNRQKEYFRWRHDHPDTTLFKIVIK